MIKIENHEKDKYYCAYSDDLNVMHIGVVLVGHVLSTGQPHLESFDTEDELETRVDELKGVGYYQSVQEAL